MKTIVHVNTAIICRNTMEGTSDPPIVVWTDEGTHQAHRVEIQGPSTVISSPHEPHRCGAQVWIETESEVRITFTELEAGNASLPPWA